MLKKTFVSITILVMILALASFSAFAQGGARKGPPTETPPATEIPDTGELYGDLYVILRDENGVPILNVVTLDVPESEEGDAYTVEVSCIQPIASSDLDLYVYDSVTDSYSVLIDTIPNHDPITIYPGEPFVPPSYVDAAGDLVECELSLTADPNNTPTDPTDDVVIYDLTPYVQAVDFGRLNLGRAPDAVIAHGFDEAINKMNLATAITLDPAGRLVLSLPDLETEDPDDTVEKTIDAPAENLALYIKMMMDGHWITTETDPVEPGGGGGKGGNGGGGGGGPPPGDGPSTEPRPVLSAAAVALLPEDLQGLGDETRTNLDLTDPELQLAASLLAGAADKSGSFSLDMVIYINSVYGINQAGNLPGEVDGRTYFNFGEITDGGVIIKSPYVQNRLGTYAGRFSKGCGLGWVWVLQPELIGEVPVVDHFVAQCIEILAYEKSDHDPDVAGVHFTDMVETYTKVVDEEGNPLEYDFIDNVRGFAQSAEDALRIIEYIHNYKVPEVLYAE